MAIPCKGALVGGSAGAGATAAVSTGSRRAFSASSIRRSKASSLALRLDPVGGGVNDGSSCRIFSSRLWTRGARSESSAATAAGQIARKRAAVRITGDRYLSISNVSQYMLTIVTQTVDARVLGRHGSA